MIFCQTTGQTPCARIDHFKQFVGLDVTRMYPAGAPPDAALTDAWTWDGFLVAAEKCAKAGYPFGMPLSTWSDSVNWVSAVFAGQGAQLVDGEGNITVKSDEVREVLAWFKKIVPFLPPSVFAWDNAANNKWLISGQGALIMNPPGAWAVAVRDAPKVAEQLWTFNSPKGPKGRFDPCSFGFWGIWNFSTNSAAAKSLLTYLSTRSSVEKLVAGSHGVDIPPFEKLRDFRIWEDEKPPTGTLYNYPPRGDVTALLAGYPAPTSLGAQMFAQGTICKLVAQCTQQGKSIDQAIDFARTELEGFDDVRLPAGSVCVMQTKVNVYRTELSRIKKRLASLRSDCASSCQCRRAPIYSEGPNRVRNHSATCAARVNESGGSRSRYRWSRAGVLAGGRRCRVACS